MIVHSYTRCYNEAELVPYFLRHWELITNKIVVYDAFSTDGSRELLQAHHKVDLRNLYIDGIDDQQLIAHDNECYKDSRDTADWVTVTDFDEFLYSSDGLRNTLSRYQDAHILQPTMFCMVDDKFPTTTGQIYDESYMGFRDNSPGKLEIFKPYVDIHFLPGKHIAYPSHPATRSEDILLLHFDNLGEDYDLRKHQARRARQSEVNRMSGLGSHYNDSDETYLCKRTNFVSHDLVRVVQ